MLQQGAVRRAAVPLQRRRAQVGREVGAGEERQPLLQARQSQALGVLLAGHPLGRHNRWRPGSRAQESPPPHRPEDAYLQQKGRWQEAPA